MSHGVPAPMLEELAREATLADVSILVDGNDAELHVHGNGAEVHDNGTELHGNGAVLKRVEMPQDLGAISAKEVPLHEGKEVILVDDNDSGQEDDAEGKVDENTPRVGLRFKTYDDALKYYKQYAEDSGFSAIILKSSYLKSGVCRSQLLNLGFVSESRYLVALKLLREMERSLLDDGLPARDRQPMLLSFEADAPENGQGLFSPQFSEGVKNSQSAHAKRRGRPLKKVTESTDDTVTQPNKEQDFLRSSFVTENTNMIQGPSSASHLEGPHMGVQGGIDLMDGIPNLSFGNHFGMDINHQHQVPNHQRMQQNNFIQVQAEPHGFGNQWVYHPMLQDNPVLRTPARRAG
ncbi:Protein FAR1-RELATED SEQUENCE 6 [Zea mays]|uniref:Protein FAR1-RELATED SEQUENCE 6 n=1 Tax=Zea mays TaxID=4577 RepID=A0A1D6HCQ5_MAIZE|nr:Protein FAR1-RELATED SEQUENCE 6 [Zea mays]AQK72485.1 Protein FAR1-RELATED SEQUENCE 6 [Zea mays]